MEVILGLPGDTPQGFQRTIRCLLDLPVRITVHWLRLDPWSDFFRDRDRLGLRADFTQEGKVTRTDGFTEEQLHASRQWLLSLRRGRWKHRARGLELSGEQDSNS